MGFASNPIGTITGYLGQQVGGAPGTGSYNVGGEGDARINPNVKPVPGSPGLYIDQTTGQILLDDGTGHPSNTVAGAPNSNQLTAQQVAQGQAQQLQQQQAFAGINKNLGAEDKAVSDLNATIAGTGAPSAAASQLATGFNGIMGNQEAIAAGANGENRVLANRSMAQNIAGSQQALNGQQALLRANEVQAAEAGRAGMLSAEGGQLGNLYTTAGSGALGYSGLATKNQGDILGTDEKAGEANAKANAGFLSNLGGGISSLAALM